MVLCRVTMLDASTFEVEVDKEANGSVLLEKVCTYLNIVESDYFGLTYVGAKDVKYWLSSDKKISKQLKAGCRWIFEFAVKFYPPEPTMLKEDIARYQLCLQLRVDLYNGKLPCSFMTHAILGSYTVQAELGDFDPSQDGPDSAYLKDFDFAPKQTAELFDKIADLHKSHKGQMPEEAELNFLENAKKLAMYGVDIHKAYDADGSMINLGVHASGLIIYRDKLRINRFVWPKILNLSYKRNNFYVKIRPDKSDTEHKICFKLDNDKMAKRLWKTCGEHHTFFRLKEGDQKKAATLFPRFNSRFRYSGRTQKQLKDRQDLIDKPKEVFERTYWKNKAAPYPDGQNRTAPVAGGDQAHPLDANDRRDKLGQDTATLSSGGPPPYKENDTLGRSANRPDAAGDVSEDRFDEERDRQATLELRGRGGDAAALAAGEGLTPGGDKGKKSKEDKEREKREKEEEKRRKKEEEKEKKRLEKEKKKKGNTSEDITDKMGDSTAGMNAPDAGSAGLDMGQGLQKLNTSEDRTDSDKDKEITEQFARGQDLSMGVSGGGVVKGEGDKGHKDKKKGDKDHKGKEIKDKKKEHDHDKKKGKKDKKDTVGSPKSDGEQSPRSPGSEDEKKGLKGGFFKFGSGRKGKGKDGKSKGDSSEPGSPSNMEFPGGLAKAGLEGNLADWPYGREGSIDRKMQFVPVEPPTTEKRDVNGLGDENTMPFFNPASLNSDNTGSLGRKTGPPVPPKGSRGSRGSGDLSEDKRFYMDGDGIRSEMPPTVQTERMKYTNDGEDIPIATTNFPIVKTETRTVTYEKDGVPAEIEDSILISSQSHSTRTQTVETTTYKTEKDGKIETRMEKRIIISEDGDDIDHDELLAEAIRSVTDMNQDLSVERIECMRQMEDVGN